MSKERGGLDIMVDDSNEFVPTGESGASEIDISSPDTENIIDPKTIASAAADAAAEIDVLENEDDPNKAPMDIIDETDKPDEDEEEPEDVVVEKEETKATKDKKPADDNEDYETFKVLGKHFSDEGILNGFDEEMENTPEALQAMVTKTVEAKVDEYKDSFKHPMAKQFLDYLENGGDPGKFVQAVSGVDYSSIESDTVDGNTTIQKQLLRDQLATQGETAEDIEELITAFEDGGQLEKRSKLALGKLQKAQNDKRAATIDAQKETKKEQITRNKEILTELKTKIDGAEEIGGFGLTKKLKGDFYKYITEVDGKSGKTGLQADSSDPENQLLMSYLYFNKFNFDKLGKKSKTSATKSLEEKLGRFSDPSSRNKSRKRTAAAKQEPGRLNLGPLKKQYG